MIAYNKIDSEFRGWSTSTSPDILTSCNRTHDSTAPPTSPTPPPPLPPSSPLLPKPASALRDPSPAQIHEEDPEEAARAWTMVCGGFPHPRHGIPRYSRIDDFIESLDAACEALPMPLKGRSDRPSRAAVKGRTFPQLQPTLKQAPHYNSYYDGGGHLRRMIKEVKFADEIIEIGGEHQGFKEVVPDATPELATPQCTKRNGDCSEAAQLAEGELQARADERRLESNCNKKRSRCVKAATKVQSTYRGYKVRKGQPLKYLVVICEVKAKLEELRHQFDAWKIAAWFPTDFTERVTMTDGVTDLLSQLDALQGVPVVVREFRKSVAREVIKFQEEVDAFLCQNSKHGVLFDMTQFEGHTPARKKIHHPKSSKAMQNKVAIAEHELNMIEKVNGNNATACLSPRSGNQNDVRRGALIFGDVTFRSGTLNKNERKAVDKGMIDTGNQPDGIMFPEQQDFVFWPPTDATFDKTGMRDKDCGSKYCEDKQQQYERITELKKCVAPVSNFDIYMSPPSRKKSHGVQFGTANIGNRNYWKQYIATSFDRWTHASTDNCHSNIYSNSSAFAESMRRSAHRAIDFDLDTDLNPGSFRGCEDSVPTVSINKQRSLDTNDNVKIHIPKDFRIAHLHESVPVDDIEVLQSFSNFKVNLTELKERTFEAGAWSDDYRKRMDRCCTSMCVDGSPNHNLESLPHSRCPVSALVQKKDGGSFESGNGHMKLYSHFTDMEGKSAKDVKDEKTPPLLISGKRSTAAEKEHPLEFSVELKGSAENASNLVVNHSDYPNPPGKTNEETKDSTAAPELECSLDHTESEPSADDVQSAKNDMPKTAAVSGAEEVEPDQAALLEMVPSGCPDDSAHPKSESVRTQNGTVHRCGQDHEQDHENKSELSGVDLETIISCSNSAEVCASGIKEFRDFESGISEEMLHQEQALKGLVGELDENVENARRLEVASRWKDRQWNQYLPREYKPPQDTMRTSGVNHVKDVKAEMEGNQWKMLQGFDGTDLPGNEQPSPPAASNPVVAPQVVSACAEVNAPTLSESRQSTLDLIGSSESLIEECRRLTSEKTDTPSDLHSDSHFNLLSEVMNENKEMKELLKEVMKWNSFQASVMLTLSERLDVVENNKI